MNTALESRLSAILAGERGALGRAMTTLDNGGPAAADIWVALRPHVGRAHVIGITGASGAGKSTLANALLGALLQRGRRIGVVAVDPSSPVSGGALLGDRLRMGQYGGHENVFIRSLSARGNPGGLSRTTARVVDLLDAAGYDDIIVETVGAGQSEVAVAALADTCIVVCPPGLGDDVQAIKAGILEIADVLVVNKSDAPQAGRTAAELQEMLRLRRAAALPVRVINTVATDGTGVADLVAAIAEHRGSAGTGRRLKPGAAAAGDKQSLEVDRAIIGERGGARFLSRAVDHDILAEVISVAGAGADGNDARPCKIHVLPAETMRRAVNGGESLPGRHCPDAPVYVLLSAGKLCGTADWIGCGMFLQRLAVAARGRGLATAVLTDLGEAARRIAQHLDLPPERAVFACLALGYAESASAIAG